MRSMLERERDFTPVTASIVDRHVLARGSQEKVVENIIRKDFEEDPDLIVLTPTCTSSILQEDLQNFADRAALDSQCDVLLSDINHYRVNEFQAADRTLEQIVRFVFQKYKDKSLGDPKNLASLKSSFSKEKTETPSVNILGIFTLGFHHQHDCRELKRLLSDLGIKVNAIIPENASIKDLAKLPKAWLNIVPYRETGLMTALYLEKEFQIPYISRTPMGVLETEKWVLDLAQHLKVSPFGKFSTEHFEPYLDQQTRFISQASWFARSVDCQNLIGKKAVVFGDATHAAAMTRILVREMGIPVSCAGTYCKHDGDWFREQVVSFCDEVLITDDHTVVADMIARLEPNAIFGSQMERHIGKRLNIPCGVISAPIHIQNFPLGYRPFFGYEGTNQIADLIYNSFTLGMEDHLLEIFGGHDTKEIISKSLSISEQNSNTLESNISSSSGLPSADAVGGSTLNWSPEALGELKKIPRFVRGKVKKNTEKFATASQIELITLETLYQAKQKLAG